MKGRRPDGWSRIGNFHISCTRVWTKADWRPDCDIWIAILALWRRASGRDTNIVRTDVSMFLYSKLGKNLKLVDHCRSSGWAAKMSGRMQASTEASWYSIGSRQYGMSSGRLERLIDGRPNWMARSSGRLTGNLNSSDLQAESSEITLNSGIPVYSIFYIQVFLSIHRMRPIKLTNSPFGHSGTKNTWPVWEYISGAKIKNYSPFLSQRDKG
jgi:hypothetical protein